MHPPLSEVLAKAEAELAAGDPRAAFGSIRSVLDYPAAELDDTRAMATALAAFARIAAAIAGPKFGAVVGRVAARPNDPEALYKAGYALYEQQLFGIAATLLARAKRKVRSRGAGSPRRHSTRGCERARRYGAIGSSDRRSVRARGGLFQLEEDVGSAVDVADVGGPGGLAHGLDDALAHVDRAAPDARSEALHVDSQRDGMGAGDVGPVVEGVDALIVWSLGSAYRAVPAKWWNRSKAKSWGNSASALTVRATAAESPLNWRIRASRDREADGRFDLGAERSPSNLPLTYMRFPSNASVIMAPLAPLMGLRLRV